MVTEAQYNKMVLGIFYGISISDGRVHDTLMIHRLESYGGRLDFEGPFSVSQHSKDAERAQM